MLKYINNILENIDYNLMIRQIKDDKILKLFKEMTTEHDAWTIESYKNIRFTINNSYNEIIKDENMKMFFFDNIECMVLKINDEDFLKELDDFYQDIPNNEKSYLMINLLHEKYPYRFIKYM